MAHNAAIWSTLPSASPRASAKVMAEDSAAARFASFMVVFVSVKRLHYLVSKLELEN